MGQPFFLYFAQFAPHTPIMPDQRFVQRYLDVGLPEREAAYASMIEGVDKSLGDIMDTLEGLGIADDTALFFTSDNGGVRNMIEHDGEPNTHNAPLNSGKGSTYEGGLRVPMLAKWPGVTEAGSVSRTPITIEDMFPTILEIAGVEFSGQSGAIVNDERHSPNSGPSWTGTASSPCCAGSPEIRSERSTGTFRTLGADLTGPEWKGQGSEPPARSRGAIGSWSIGTWTDARSCSTLRDDIGETRNLASEQPELVAELSSSLGKFLREANAIMPTRKATGAPVPYPDKPRGTS